MKRLLASCLELRWTQGGAREDGDALRFESDFARKW